jgi:hypothetical protein
MRGSGVCRRHYPLGKPPRCGVRSEFCSLLNLRPDHFETLLALAVEPRDELAESKPRFGNGYVGTVPTSSSPVEATA